MKTVSIFTVSFLMFLACENAPKKELNNVTEKQELINWARSGAQSQMSGAYFAYQNPLNVADTLVSINSDIAAMTQIHESYRITEGLAGMREMKQVIVEPQGHLTLKRGGLHVMLMNLKSDLSTGDSVQVQLTFTQAGVIKFSLPVLSSN